MVSMLRRALVRDLRARRAQFIAIWATILLGVALFGASYDAFQNLTASYQQLYDNLALADLTVSGGPVAQIATDGAALPGVDAAATRSVGDGLIRIDGRSQLGRVIGLPPDGTPAVDRVMVLRGRNLQRDASNEVLVEQHLASARGLEPGASMDVLTGTGWRTVVVAGIVASPEYIWPARSRQEELIPPDQWGVIFGPESLVAAMPSEQVHQEALFRLATDAPSDTLAKLTSLALADGAVSTQTQADQPSLSALKEDVSGFAEMSIMFPVMFLLAGLLATSVLLGRMVASQRGQIGVLLANGFARRTILLHYLSFGVLVGLAGSIPGAILGGLSAAAISHLYTGAIAVPITVVHVRPMTVLIGLLMGPLAGAAAAYLPARRAARTSPAEAMRGAAPVGRGGASLAERLMPPLRRLPTRWLVSLRGLGRSPRRSLSTIVGVALATTLILVSWGMVDTTQILLERQFLQIQRQDATIYFSSPVAASQVSTVVSDPDIAAVEPQLQLHASIIRGDKRYATTLVGLERTTTMHGFLASDGSTLALPVDGLLLGSALQGTLGVSVGDTVEVDPGTGAAPTPERVAGFVNENLGTFAYGSIETVGGLAGQSAQDPNIDSALIRYVAGSDRAAVAGRLAALPGIAGVFDNRTLYDMAQQYMGLFYVFIGVMLALGAIMAFALIFNTMTANVTERATELAALRTLGMSRATLSRLITGENLLLTLLGLVPGLIVGYAVAAEFMASFSSDLFNYDLHVRPTTFVFTALAILVVGFVSQWPALRAVGRLDLGRIVRERAT
jgi:putative ABC transport system permease protein